MNGFKSVMNFGVLQKGGGGGGGEFLMSEWTVAPLELLWSAEFVNGAVNSRNSFNP